MYLVLWFFILWYIGGLVSRTIFRHAKQRCSRPDAPAFGKLLLWLRNGVLWPQKYNLLACLLGKLCKAEQCLPGMFITPKFTGESRCKPKSTTQFFGGMFFLPWAIAPGYRGISVFGLQQYRETICKVPKYLLSKFQNIHTLIKLHTKIICSYNVIISV